MKVNLYDFDKTIYKGDSSTDFFFFSLMKRPRIIRRVPKIIGYAVLYKIGKKTKTEMKEVIFSFLEDIPNVNQYVKEFWESHACYIKEFYLKKEHKQDIIISASPEFLLNPMVKKLKVLDFMGSIVDKKTGEFNGLNCHGEEKVRRLHQKYERAEVMKAYSDSHSDDPMLKLAKSAYYVKGEKCIPVDFYKNM